MLRRSGHSPHQRIRATSSTHWRQNLVRLQKVKACIHYLSHLRRWPKNQLVSTRINWCPFLHNLLFIANMFMKYEVKYTVYPVLISFSRNWCVQSSWMFEKWNACKLIILWIQIKGEITFPIYYYFHIILMIGIPGVLMAIICYIEYRYIVFNFFSPVF